MTREETKKAIEVMQAFVDGKEIEVLTTDKKYCKTVNPKWNWFNNSNSIYPEYRVCTNNAKDTKDEMINLLQSVLDKADFDYDTHKKLDDFLKSL